MTNTRLRYSRIGIFGQSALLEDTNRLVAVKELIWRWSCSSNIGEKSIQPSLNHPYILTSFHSQGWGTPHVQIFTDLMSGTITQLVDFLPEPCMVLATHVLHQMLQALTYLACHGYVHCDVKPDNILYTHRNHQDQNDPKFNNSPYRFKLSNFGLCTHESSSRTVRGTILFLPPPESTRVELGEGSVNEPQTHKGDVWALYVSVL
ncbi:hypothetical protein N0V88_000287 [Collariella sp. IMI 366227]|nr:hypothetical protein N0V88_000287 [Collariella sp. IMI 366227]